MGSNFFTNKMKLNLYKLVSVVPVRRFLFYWEFQMKLDSTKAFRYRRLQYLIFMGIEYLIISPNFIDIVSSSNNILVIFFFVFHNIL